MSENTETAETTDASEVVFWGFPASVQEQVGCIVAAATFSRRHVAGDELHLPSCKLAFYWWPEREDTAKMQLQLLRRANQSSQFPIIVVATSQTRKCASEAMGLDAEGILIWPFSLEQFAEGGTTILFVLCGIKDSVAERAPAVGHRGLVYFRD
jgi:hypothetical protein